MARLLCLTAICGTFLAAGSALAQAPPAERVKFIELGWDIPDTAFLAEHWRQMEAEGPFDGVMFRFAETAPDGRAISSETVWNTQPWEAEWLDGAIEDLRSCQWTKFRHNFCRFNATPDRIDWADDAGWATLAEKARLCARLVREGGAQGLAPDFEPYGSNQWNYDPARDGDFAATYEVVRQRGQQWISAIAAEMPNAVILTLFSNSLLDAAGRADDPFAALKSHPYAFLPAFWDGMIAGASDEMILVDGCETGYYKDSVEEFLQAAKDMRSWSGPSLRLVSPERRAKARLQAQAGFGVYVDMYINPEGHTYYRPPLDGSRLARFERNLRAARDAADEYVWIYGEQSRWWSGLAPWRTESLANTAGRGLSWEEVLPGVTRMIDRLRDPAAVAAAGLARARAQGPAANLLANPDFTEPGPTPTSAPAGWSAWQNEALGVFSHDPAVGGGSALGTKVRWGTFIQNIPAQPGEMYYLSVRLRQAGSGQPTLSSRWQTSDNVWVHEALDRIASFGPPDADGWQRAELVVTVPPDAGQLCFLVGWRGQETDQDQIWVDDAELYRVDE